MKKDIDAIVEEHFSQLGFTPTSYLYNSIILSLRATGLVAFGDKQRGGCDNLLKVAGTNS